MEKCSRCHNISKTLLHPMGNIDIELCEDCWAKWIAFQQSYVNLRNRFFSGEAIDLQEKGG